MTQEDKAKRYDDALAKAKEAYQQGYYVKLVDIENIFPELKESEGERIRKGLLYAIEHHPTLPTEEAEEYIAWVEKQGKKECSAPYVETSIKDGVYLVYEGKNGKRWCELFSGHNDKENAIGVAFKFGQVSLRLYKNDLKECDITTKQGIPCEHTTSFDEATCDFDGKRKTEMIFECGLSCVDRFPESKDWYIPAIGELHIMYVMKNQINKALKHIGAELIKDAWYWSSSEGFVGSAWAMGFGSGYFNFYSKSRYSFMVRPVSAFDPLTL